MNPERSKILTAILAHNEPHVLPPISRHMPFWIKHSDLVFISPNDKPLKIAGHRNENIGQSGHTGLRSIARFRSVLKRVAELAPKDGLVILHEYDSVIISDLPEIDMGALNCIAFENREPDRWGAAHYLHPPWIIPSRLFPAINASARHVPDSAEESCLDRWLAVVIEQGKVPLTCFPKGSYYSQNSILPEHYDSCRAAAKAGASVFHGPKSKEAFELIFENSPWTNKTA